MEEKKSPIVISDGEDYKKLLPLRDINIYYSQEIADQVIDRYLSGESLWAISRIEGLPSYCTILRWLKDKEEFLEEFEKARRIRAIHLEDKIAQESEILHDKDDVGGARLQFDARKWLAEHADPSRFGQKVTVQGDKERPIQIVVKTGVPHAEEVQAEKRREIVEVVSEVQSGSK